jgi:hypothetical protein
LEKRYLLGIYDETVCKEFNAIKEIRNKFAHAIDVENFATNAESRAEKSPASTDRAFQLVARQWRIE